MELPRTYEWFEAFASDFLWFSDEEYLDALKSYTQRRKMLMSRDEFDGDTVYVLWFEHMPDVWVAMYYDIHPAFDAVLWWNNKK